MEGDWLLNLSSIASVSFITCLFQLSTGDIHRMFLHTSLLDHAILAFRMHKLVGNPAHDKREPVLDYYLVCFSNLKVEPFSVILLSLLGRRRT